MERSDPRAGAEVRGAAELQVLYGTYFKTRFPFDPRRDTVWREVVRWLQARYIRPDARVLDLGAGYCNFINHVRAAERHAVDVFGEIEDYAAPGVQVHPRPATDLSCFADGSLDVIFASNLIEHLTRPESLLVLREAHRILVPGGRVILMQPNFKYCATTYFDDYTHVQIFTDVSLSDFVATCGFRVQSIPRFLPVNMKSKLRVPVPFLAGLVQLYLSLPFRPLAGQMLVVGEKPGRGPGEPQ